MDENDLSSLQTGSLLRLEKICRSCLAENKEMHSLFMKIDIFGPFKDVYSVVMECASVQIVSGDGLPHLICQECINQLNSAYTFKKRCEDSDVKLRNFLISLNTLSLDGVVKKETEIKPEVVEDPDRRKLRRKKIQCKHCARQLLSKSGYKLHLKMHATDKHKLQYTCEQCDEAFAKVSQLAKHQRKEHRDDLSNDDDEAHAVTELPEPDDLTNTDTKKDYECEHCHKVLTTKNGLVAHSRRHEQKSMTCEVCAKTFAKHSHLKRHLMLAHNITQVKRDGDVSLQCEFCDRKFSYRKSFALHMRGEHEIYEMDEDGNSLDVKPDIDELAVPADLGYALDGNGAILSLSETIQMKLEHEENDLNENDPADVKTDLECHVCKERFTRSNHLTRHMIMHRNLLTHKCSKCDKSFFSHDFLNEHVKKFHASKPYVCLNCNKLFPRPEYLIRHLFGHHATDDNDTSPKSEEFKCSVCDRKFSKSGLLAKHIKQHLLKEKRFKCEQCNKAFTRLDNLKTHQRIHAGNTNQIKLHLCVYCGKEFNNSSNLIVHMRRHTGERPYRCPTCDKGFPRSHDLKCHERIHSGERPYLCTLCGKSFNKSNKLVRHTRVHTGERPYVCNICERAFTQSNDLALHMRRHTGARPYACMVCDARFIQGGQLKAHRRATGHVVEQEIQFRGNRVEPVYIDGFVETPVRFRKGRSPPRKNDGNETPSGDKTAKKSKENHVLDVPSLIFNFDDKRMESEDVKPNEEILSGKVADDGNFGHRGNDSTFANGCQASPGILGIFPPPVGCVFLPRSPRTDYGYQPSH